MQVAKKVYKLSWLWIEMNVFVLIWMGKTCETSRARRSFRLFFFSWKMNEVYSKTKRYEFANTQVCLKCHIEEIKTSKYV